MNRSTCIQFTLSKFRISIAEKGKRSSEIYSQVLCTIEESDVSNLVPNRAVEQNRATCREHSFHGLARRGSMPCCDC